MAVSLVRVKPTSGTQGANLGTLTVAFDATGCDYLVVRLTYGADAGGSIATYSVTTATYAGAAMTALAAFRKNSGSASAGQAVYGIAAPSTGSNNVVITMSGTPGAPELSYEIMGFSGVGSAALVAGQSNDDTNSTSPPNTTATLASGDMLLGLFNHGDTISSSPTTGTLGVVNNYSTHTAGGCGVIVYNTGTGSVSARATSAVSDHWMTDAVKLTASGGAATNANAGVATVTVVANGATITAAPAAGVATVTVAGLGAAPSVAPTAGLATVTAVALAAAPSVAATAGLATVSVTALNPTVSTSGNTNAPAGLATVSVSAYGAAPSMAPTAGVATVTAAALGAATSIAPTAGIATVTVAALSPAPSVAVSAGVATVTASALNPTVTTGGATTNASAGVATVSLVAYGASITGGVKPSTGTVTAAAYGATAGIGAAAGLATVGVTAYGAKQSISVLAGLATVAVGAYNAATTGGVIVDASNHLTIRTRSRTTVVTRSQTTIRTRSQTGVKE